jgi:hypothetical protein
MDYCKIRQGDINYTFMMSTGMLTRHMRSKHRKEYQAVLEEVAVKKLKLPPMAQVHQHKKRKISCSVQLRIMLNSTLHLKKIACLDY